MVNEDRLLRLRGLLSAVSVSANLTVSLMIDMSDFCLRFAADKMFVYIIYI